MTAPARISRAVARGTTRLLAGLLGAKALDFALYLLLARELGVESFGRYTFALSFTLLFGMLADLGLSTIFTREVARAPQGARALLGTTLRLKAALAVITLAATALVSAATGAPTATTVLVAAFTAAMLLNSAALLFEGLLKADGRAGVAGLAVFAQSTTALVTGAALVLSGRGVSGAAIAYLAAGAVHLSAAAWASRALWRGHPDAGEPEALPVPGAELPDAAAHHPPSARRLVREAAPVALSSLFIALYFRVDAVMLHAMQGERAVGLYGGIYRFFEGFVLLSAAYRSVLYPVMSRAADGPAEALGALCRRSIRLHLLFTLGVATFISFQARPIVTLVLGPAYAEAAAGLAVLVWALPGAFMADTLLHLLTAQRRQAEGTRVAVVVALANVALNAALIPRLSFVGAALATAVSETLCFALLAWAFARTARVGLARAAWPPAVAAAALAAALLLGAQLVPGGAVGLAAAAVFGALTYGGALVATGAVGRDEARLLLDILPGHAGEGRAG